MLFCCRVHRKVDGISESTFMHMHRVYNCYIVIFQLFCSQLTHCVLADVAVGVFYASEYELL